MCVCHTAVVVVEGGLLLRNVTARGPTDSDPLIRILASFGLTLLLFNLTAVLVVQPAVQRYRAIIIM